MKDDTRKAIQEAIRIARGESDPPWIPDADRIFQDRLSLVVGTLQAALEIEDKP